jgi:hypothetical protein
MALKTWIDDIKTAEGGSGSEAQLEQAGEKAADIILFGARDQIIKGGVFHFTPETHAAEMEVDRAYKAILEGGRDFATLQAACARWVEVAQKPPAPPVMASLFEG